MVPETNAILPGEKVNALNTVTPLSKYLAMVLFVVLPFVGGWVGYTYAPEKIVEVEKVLNKVEPEVIETVTQETVSYARVLHDIAQLYPQSFVYDASSTFEWREKAVDLNDNPVRIISVQGDAIEMQCATRDQCEEIRSEIYAYFEKKSMFKQSLHNAASGPQAGFDGYENENRICLVQYRDMDQSTIRVSCGVLTNEVTHVTSTSTTPNEQPDITGKINDLGLYRIIDNQVYYISESSTTNMSSIFVIETESFRVLNPSVDPISVLLGDVSIYAIDNKSVFINDNRIVNADPETFTINLFEDPHFYTWSKDKNHVYFRGQKVYGADPITFEVISEGNMKDCSYRGYGKDSSKVFYGTEEIMFADPDTFQILGGEYSKDSNRTFFKSVQTNLPENGEYCGGLGSIQKSYLYF